MRLGLTSVTFRSLSPEGIVALAMTAGIDFMEWGTDVHAKTAEDARYIRALCDGTGLATASLGSYYRVGVSEVESFRKDLEIAEILGAKRIRLWLGDLSSADTDEALFEKMKNEVRILSDMASEKGIELGFEFHRRTLNDNAQSSLCFLDAVGRENVKTYWQPFFKGQDMENLSAVKDRVCAVHMFSWDGAANRFPFSAHEGEWGAFLGEMRGRLDEIDFIMEFVMDDDEEQFLVDVAAIRRLFASFE